MDPKRTDTQAHAKLVQIYRDSFKLYARDLLKIRAKDGAVHGLVLNPAQLNVFDRLAKQLAEKGRIRALILKSRQQGISTLIEGLFFWRTVYNKGMRTFILTHEDEATKNLFEMAKRYYDCLPVEFKPKAASANAREMQFEILDSGYRVGTAGNKAAGRSSTVQHFHGSEVAFWPNAEEHLAGVLQAVPDTDGTAIILESTANGLGNVFHRLWQDAESGKSDYLAIFIPWFVQPEYRKTPPGNFSLSMDEADYRDAYDLTSEQMYWRRMKIAELGSDWKFKQEYPATAAEAFQSSTTDPLISNELVMKARNSKIEDTAKLVIGVDPARFGNDRTTIALRTGRHLKEILKYEKKNLMETAGVVARLIRDKKPAAVFIDDVGLGGGITDRLREQGFTILPINGGQKAIDDDKYANRNAEMWIAMKKWLEGGARVPDSDELHADLTGREYGYDSHGRIRLEKKEDMKKRGLRSPDMADALALTFAEPIAVHEHEPLEMAQTAGGQDGFYW